jgi:hypothetical protein
MTEPVDPLQAAKDEVTNRVRTVLDLNQPDSVEAVAEAVEVVFGLLWGQLRGRIPTPVPVDLMAVAASATVRLTEALNRRNYVNIGNGLNMEGTGTPPTSPSPTFTFPELVVLHRYRKRTA